MFRGQGNEWFWGRVKRVIRTSPRFGKHWEIVSVIPNHVLGFNIGRFVV
jgi:hypothetical protein